MSKEVGFFVFCNWPDGPDSLSHKAKMIFTLTTRKPWSHKSCSSNISSWRHCEQLFVPFNTANLLILIKALNAKKPISVNRAMHVQLMYLFLCQKIAQNTPKCCYILHLEQRHSIVHTSLRNCFRLKQKYCLHYRGYQLLRALKSECFLPYTQDSQTATTINLKLCGLMFKRHETEADRSYICPSFTLLPCHSTNTDAVYRIKALS